MEVSKNKKVIMVSPGDFMANHGISPIGKEQIEHAVGKMKKEIDENSSGVTILRGKNRYLKDTCEIIRSELPTQEVLEYPNFSDKKWEFPSPEAIKSISENVWLFIERIPREIFLFLPGINVVGQLTVQIIDMTQCRDEEILRKEEKEKKEKQMKLFDEPAFQISYEKGVIVKSTSGEIPNKNVYSIIKQGGMIVVIKPVEREFCIK
ncbi:MAG: hypothetical protein Q7R98_02655 [Candidatus Jorgensenbacteria bacterium]|nr:hypothetical protein [Candidatus Jorgensenbacteria bacterium]